MKNWLYIPFLILMAVTYRRVTANFTIEEFTTATRGPALVEVFPNAVGMDIYSKF